MIIFTAILFFNYNCFVLIYQGGNGGGGSDVGLFVGGLASAILRGVTGQQGAVRFPYFK